MKAFILAAGYGTRLEPLTLAVPKPMVPIVNLPIMRHNLELLGKYGFNEVFANIHYHPEQIKNYFGTGITYSFEEELLGTAGGVLRMSRLAGSVEDAFVVLSSDALTDIDLSRFLSYHREKKALATIALAPVSSVSEFGIVVMSGDGKIVGFQEKPEPGSALSNLANAGIYIFEAEVLRLIPDGFYDFGRQLFPELVKMKASFYGYPMQEYWSDVGSIEKYVQANYDALRGAVKVRIPGGVRSGHSIVGERCVISAGAEVVDSIVWSDTSVGAGARVKGAVVGSFCRIGEKAVIQERAVIANRCVIRPSAVVPAGARLLPDSVF